jgi:hypothetical protein
MGTITNLESRTQDPHEDQILVWSKTLCMLILHEYIRDFCKNCTFMMMVVMMMMMIMLILFLLVSHFQPTAERPVAGGSGDGVTSGSNSPHSVVISCSLNETTG